MTLEALNSLPATDARVALERCCGASRWIEAMLAVRPFGTAAALFAASDRAFAPLERADWLQAFAHHPKIGDVSALRAKFAGTAAWAGAEQGGAASATEATLQALAECNRAYEERFGYIFIVCATGKTAGDMLTLLNARLDNAADAELSLAAAEQRKITRLRIEKLLGETA
ncbi:MAG: 2-oxo-4-hydroxy-4-carboxy-5-ureidoimidazoline decarboxylase [Candidatus Eisenbacteria bacterium]